ncbi:MAG: hypothetical protein PHD06_04320 [Bacteroidales bacterium]|nr:hypothetical protein [Bacteroidales bacterium]MDD4384385.1 hypothetical protein [Bacteroidales bacterium]
MKKNYKNLFIIFLGIVATLISCEKETTIIIPCEKVTSINISENRFLVKDGIIHFTNLNSFKSVMADIKELKTKELENWEVENGIENSLRKFQELSNETEEVCINKLIPDSHFATVVNKEGLFAIGDSMHYITHDKEYVYKLGDEVSLDNIRSNNKVRVFDIVKDNSAKNWADKYFYFNKTEFGIPPSSAYKSYRVICYAWSTSWLAYCSNGCGIKCEYRDKNWLGQLYWRKARFDNVEVCGQARYYINSKLFASYNCDSGTNVSDEDCFIGQGAGTIYTYWIAGNFNFKFDNGWPIYYVEADWD